MEKDTTMTIDFADAFKTDLVEICGYLKAESKRILNQKSQDLIDDMINDM